MPKYSALLIGASEYVQPGIQPLRFVRQDIEVLADALRARGTDVTVPRSDKPVSANFINGEVSAFLKRAETGQSLLIALSGHGLHAGGQDYLVPEDLHPEISPVWSGCVSVDWQAQVENTRAAQVLFLIDACREGVDHDGMGAVGWASSKAKAVAGRKVAHMYACSPGEVARFVDAEKEGSPVPGGSFSIFSRAVSDVLAAPSGPVDLEGLQALVQSKIADSYQRYRKLQVPQRVRVRTTDVQKEFVVAAALRRRRAATAGGPPPLTPPPPDPVGCPPGPGTDDPGQKLAETLHQVLALGRLDALEPFVAVSDTDQLADMAGLLTHHDARERLWAGIAAQRPPGALMELVKRLFADGHQDAPGPLVAHAAAARQPGELLVAAKDAGLPSPLMDTVRGTVLRVVGERSAATMAAAVDDLVRGGFTAEADLLLAGAMFEDDLPEALRALDGYGRTAEADGLILRAVRGSAPGQLDRTVVRASSTAVPRHRVVALEAVATLPIPGVTEWMAGLARPDAGRDMAFVLAAMMELQSDWHVLLPALRNRGLPSAAVVRQALENLGERELSTLLDHLVGGPVEAEAFEVVRVLLVPFRSRTALALLSRYRQYGGPVLLRAVLDGLPGAPACQVVEFLHGVENEPAVFAEVTKSLSRICSAAELLLLVRALGGTRLSGLGAGLWRVLVEERPADAVCAALEFASADEAAALLAGAVAAARCPGRLAELVEMPGHTELAARFGALAVGILLGAVGEAAVTGLLFELLERGWTDGADRLLRGLAAGWPPDPLLRLTRRLAAGRYGNLADLLVDRAAEHWDVKHFARLLEGPPGRARIRIQEALDRTLRTRRPEEFLRLIVQLAAVEPWSGGGIVANQGQEMLLRVAEGEAETFAALLRRLGAIGRGIPKGIVTVGLVRRFLAVHPAEQGLLLLRHLHAGEPEYRTDAGTARAFREQARRLLRALGEEDAETREHLWRVCRTAPQLRPFELRNLLADLRTHGMQDEAVDMRELLLEVQTPETVARLLFEYQGVSRFLRQDFEAVCGRAIGMPVADAADLLAILERAAGPDHWFTACYAACAPPARVRAVVLELIADGRAAVAATVLTAGPWSEPEGESGGWPVEVEVFANLIPSLEPATAVRVLHHLVEGGASERVLSALLRGAAAGDVFGLWWHLQARQSHRLAARLVDLAPPETDIAHWYRELARLPVPVDRAAVLAETASDLPFPRLPEGREPAPSQLAAAVLHRVPEEAAELLTALVARPAVLVRTVQVLAAARPLPELVDVLRRLDVTGESGLFFTVLCRVASHEPDARFLGLLRSEWDSTFPTVVARLAGSAEAHEMASLITTLAGAHHSDSADLLITRLVVQNRSGADMARLLNGLKGLGAPEVIRDRVAAGYCLSARTAEVASFLHGLARPGLERDLRQAIGVVVRAGPERTHHVRADLAGMGANAVLGCSGRMEGDGWPHG
ncbi:caspase family protein [Kitasatospora sp. NPDC057198]|uniref:caspase family protein n=1 Tax=Kitasatospora sp. NPDC057198 TaxID=3346046 RepID=UPI003633EF21